MPPFVHNRPMHDATGDRLSQYLHLLTASLDEDVPVEEAARRAHLSRFHFSRLVQGATRERPAGMRRRLLLERAAWQAARTSAPIIDIALSAGYESASSFTRAFVRAFGHTPSAHRLTGGDFRIAAANGIHFHPPGAVYAGRLDAGGGAQMDFVDRMLAHDDWATEQLLARAEQLSDAQLDAPLDLGAGNHPEVTAGTLRELLDRLVFTREMWTASIEGKEFHDEEAGAPSDLLRRWRAITPAWRALVEDIRDRGRWDDAFIDVCCDPPETFVLGAAVLHVVTYTAYRRTLALGVLRSLGVEELGWADPIDWERQRAADL